MFDELLLTCVLVAATLFVGFPVAVHLRQRQTAESDPAQLPGVWCPSCFAIQDHANMIRGVCKGCCVRAGEVELCVRSRALVSLI